MDWTEKTYSLRMLQLVSQDDDQIKPAIDWLKHIGVIPKDVDWKRRNALTKTSLDPEKIKASYLAELAYDWDQDGPTTPGEFVEALEFEVAGTEKNASVSEVTGNLGRENNEGSSNREG